MHIFIVLKGSLLPLKKLRGNLSCKDGCMGEKFEDVAAKICHFVINDAMRNGLSGVGFDVIVGTKVDGRGIENGEVGLSSAVILDTMNVIRVFLKAKMIFAV